MRGAMAAPQGPPQGPYAPPYPPPYPYPPPWYPQPWYPPPKKDDSKLALIVIIVVIIIVVVPIIMAAVLFVMVSGLIGAPDPAAPQVVFSAPSTCGATCWAFVVAGISDRRPLTEFHVVLLVNASSLGTSPLRDGPTHDDGFHRLWFADLDGDADLTAGDEFRLDSQGGPANCEVELLWAPTGEVLDSLQWSC